MSPQTSPREGAGLQREQEKLQSHNRHESRLPSGHRIVSLFSSHVCAQLLVRNHVLRLRLLNVLEVIAPFKHFNKLREFVQMKLPPGFPVKLGEETS